MSASIAIVGVGVRGVVTLTRIAAQLHEHPGADLDIHLIDPRPHGGGRTWRTDQSPLLLMNGPATTVTAYPGPDPAGPTLLQWCQGVAAGSIGVDLPARYRAEVRRTGPESYASRALYGWYLRWVLERAVRALPDQVRVHRHEASVTDLVEMSGGTLSLGLSTGATVVVDAAALALGWLPRQVVQPPTRADRWIPPLQPADQDLRAAAPGARVFLRGLGMNFFDTLVLLTEGRGGRFVDDGEGRLAYEPSGREPVLLAGSRRGVPFRTKPAVPPSAGVRHEALSTVLAEHPAGRPWDIAGEVMPAIRLDAIHSHDEAVAALRRAGVAAPVDSLDVDSLQDPAAGRSWPDHQAWAAWLKAYLKADLKDAVRPGARCVRRCVRSGRPGRWWRPRSSATGCCRRACRRSRG